ncbi:DUF721 domain-containing protein [Candidatus Uhrbacteria bacterium]|nr:DUF721 domain-containing protein [Candidatus Uhrbacteria bacterium]
MFESIRKLTASGLGKTGENSRRIAAAVILEKATSALIGVFGDGAAGNLTPVSFRDGRLVVSARHGVWSQDVVIRRDEAIRAINREIGQDAVREISVR